MSKKFDNAARVEELIWIMRLADLQRGEDRAVINRTFNGNPPWSEQEAEENHVEINRNDLSGPNALAQARRQWNNAFLKPGNYFNVSLDSGPVHKRAEWSHIITREINRRLKKRRGMMEQIRQKGASAMLHGVAPVIWKDRRSPLPCLMPVSSVLMPSETDLDFENVEYFAMFHESTPSTLYDLTHGPKVDPGWNMEMVMAEVKRVGQEIQKQPNATAYQFMPERVEELVKQDKGFWGSDAVPTVDYWTFYFREADDGKGWYRRVILDWGPEAAPQNKDESMPKSRSIDDKGKSQFLYTSGDRVYANSLSEIIHCQFADCSAVAPFKYRSVRSLGWMLWGICDLQSRLHCKFNEAVFQSLLWYFRVANEGQLTRLRQVNFAHMGVIPQGIEFVKAQDRYTPDYQLVAAAFGRNRQVMSENAAAFTQDFDKGAGEKEMTATETMARVNSVNALVSGMLNLAYTYEEFNFIEICRRFCIKRNPDRDVRLFRLGCLKAGVNPDMLDHERWDVTAERVLGAGNKTLEMAQVQFLQGMRKNLNPDAQRHVDHISIESATDDYALAEELAPISKQKRIASSVLNAEYATERILRGLPFTLPEDAVWEDYLLVWLNDLKTLVQQMQQPVIGPNAERLAGGFALAQNIEPLIKQLAQDKEQKQKAGQYHKALKQLEMALVKLARVFQQKMKHAQPAGGQADPQAEAAGKVAIEHAKTQANLQGKMLLDQAKAANMQEAHASRTAQKEISAELAEQRKDRQAAAELRRKHVDHAHETALSSIRALQESNEPAHAE